MRLAIVYWQMVGQVGGIATHLNTLRAGALRAGDACDILVSGPRVSQTPGLFPERKAVKGKDNWIWADGVLPHHPANVEASVRFLERNYDAVLFGSPCPTETKAYPVPLFRPVYDVRLPAAMFVMDGYWDTYAEWADPLVCKVAAVLCPLDSYAAPVRARHPGTDVVISPFPFAPRTGRTAPKAATPLLVWPNQWKGIKGVKEFVGAVPNLTAAGCAVEMYSCGIEYYQMRQTPEWKAAVGRDEFGGFHGAGAATYKGNVELPVVWEAVQRAWFTCNLQGMKTRKDSYRRGSYNNTEVEALWYGACPVLHSSTRRTVLPADVYVTVDRADEIPAAVSGAAKSGFALDPARTARAREFVLDTHFYVDRYADLRRVFA